MDEEDDIIDYLENVLSTLDKRAERMVSYPDGREMKKRYHGYELENIVEAFLKGESTKRIILMPGLRGTGKTTIMFQLYNLYKTRFDPGNILFLECDRITEVINTSLSDVLRVYENKVLKSDFESLDEKVMILVDEAHYQKGWAPIVKSFSDRSHNALFIVTGSSSLSFETTTDLVRRSSTEKLFPLSFTEYILLKSYLQDGKEIRPPEGLVERFYKACFGDLSSEDRFDLLQRCTLETRTRYLPTVGNIDIEMEEYMIKGTFPFTIPEEEETAFEELFNICKRVIHEDMPQFSNLSSKSIEKVISSLRVVACSSREVSLQTIADSVQDISPHTISEIFNVLHRAGMVYILEPFGSTAKKVISKSPRYYLSTPNLQATLQWMTGKLDRKSGNMGLLLETTVASTLYRLSETCKEVGRCWHDYKKGGADFIVELNDGKRSVLEVGWGKKSTGQVMNSLKRVEGDYALVVSDRKEEHQRKEINDRVVDIYFIPKEMFMMI